MYKFFRSAKAETIRKLQNPLTGKVDAIIGRVDEMIRLEVIFPDEIPESHYHKWISITAESEPRIDEFDTYEEAKAYWKDRDAE